MITVIVNWPKNRVRGAGGSRATNGTAARDEPITRFFWSAGYMNNKRNKHTRIGGNELKSGWGGGWLAGRASPSVKCTTQILQHSAVITHQSIHTVFTPEILNPTPKICAPI